jgi:hypothetical protein
LPELGEILREGDQIVPEARQDSPTVAQPHQHGIESCGKDLRPIGG